MPALPSGRDAPPEKELSGRNLLLGVSGGIAAYKTAPLVRRFKKAGADVQVLMTESARRFVSPLTLGTLSEREVLSAIFPDGPGEPESEGGAWTKHVSLGLWADLFVVAPATAQTLAKLAGGFSDSMLTATALSAQCPLLVCPSMDRDMYAHPAVERNLRTLSGDGHTVMPAARGELASGLTGPGRMPEPRAIFDRVAAMLSDREEEKGKRGRGGPRTAGGTEPAKPPPYPLADRRVLVTAGPTREPIDPVRHLSNPSTGTMGFALAEAAAQRGAAVTLVAGPTGLATPPGVERVDVETADEMHAAATEHAAGADLVLMAAAVADYTPAAPSDAKLKKDRQNGDALVLRLHRTPDILAALGEKKPGGQRLLGFALETDDGPTHARRKLREKNLDWIVLNSPTREGSGFGTGANEVTLIGADGREEAFDRMPKRALADALLDRVAASTEAADAHRGT
jgi:phosphopantothenoylcysteine decarboxylase/phosphopantothenate--cysteine ligase